VVRPVSRRHRGVWALLRAPEELSPDLLRLLGLVSLALFFESYDLSMLTSALPYIATDLGMSTSNLGFDLAVIRLGALPIVLAVPLIDRLGRRRLFLVAIVATSVGTVATAFAPDQRTFVVLQMAVRGVMLLGAATAVVIVTEEFPAAHRGWAIGALGALSASGHGLGALLFSFIEHLPGGWRALYAVGVLPLALVPTFRREVAETRRFARLAAAGAAWPGWVEPIRAFLRTHPDRAARLTTATLLVSVGDVATFQFTSYFAKEVHGWRPAEYATMFILAGAIGIVGNWAAGRLGDVIGRRRVGAGFFAAFPVAAVLFYNGPGWTMPLAFGAFVFCQTAGGTIIRALSTELFPTAHRGTSAGWISLVQTAGWALGLSMIGLWATDAAGIARATSAVSFAVLAGGLVLLGLPETRRRELEHISEEAHP
jgi:MFS family permease